jgi:tRNA-Thr(GGU) m(6)t(6)A37 methyltransferase TsaA
MDPITYHPIGRIRTAFTDVVGMPIQASAAGGTTGRIELDPALVEGLVDLEGFSHLILIYALDRTGPAQLSVVPFLDDTTHGVFATRAPARPNAIGISVVRLLSIDGATVSIADLDMLDGTPLLDIKPYVPRLDDRADARIGWYAGRLDRLPAASADERFGGTAGGGEDSSETTPRRGAGS